MRKIGATSTGSVIIEMTAAQFAALTQVVGGEQEATPERTSEKPVAFMAVKRKQAFVLSCLEKLRPETRKEMHRSIRAMFSANGGIGDREVEHIIECLVKGGNFSFDEDGRTHFPESAPGRDTGKEQSTLVGVDTLSSDTSPPAGLAESRSRTA